ncbi:MAG: hypothetical protein WDN49_18680 [Acetobacteraceae bacterium]
MMFPLPRRGADSLATQRKQLAATLYAQAAVGAFSMGVHDILAAEGFRSCRRHRPQLRRVAGAAGRRVPG